MKLVAVFLSCFFLFGCAGIMIDGTDDYEVLTPWVTTERALIQASRVKVMEKQELLSLWGQPAKIEKKQENLELWTYEIEEKIEKEVSLYLGLFPVSLKLPDEAQKVIFTISGNKVVKASAKISTTAGGMCGLVPTQHFGLKVGCTQ